MELLNDGVISANTACAQAKLVSQACNLLNYELKRTALQVTLKKMGETVADNSPRIREIESKAFDDTI